MLIASIVFNVFLLIMLSVSMLFNIKCGLTIIRVQDAIEYSLDELDRQYEKIDAVLQIPLFFESPEIKRVHMALRQSKNSILFIANRIVESIEGNEDEEDEGDK